MEKTGQYFLQICTLCIILYLEAWAPEIAKSGNQLGSFAVFTRYRGAPLKEVVERSGGIAFLLHICFLFCGLYCSCVFFVLSLQCIFVFSHFYYAWTLYESVLAFNKLRAVYFGSKH